MLTTKIDDFAELTENKTITLKEAAKTLGWSVGKVESLARFLDSRGIVKLIYPALLCDPYCIDLFYPGLDR